MGDGSRVAAVSLAGGRKGGVVARPKGTRQRSRGAPRRLRRAPPRREAGGTLLSPAGSRFG